MISDIADSGVQMVCKWLQPHRSGMLGLRMHVVFARQEAKRKLYDVPAPPDSTLGAGKSVYI